MYLGAKHMVTGYDHLLFLVGVIFFLYRTSEVLKYVSLFTLGHSVTLLLGVWANVPANAYLIDAVIGLSVVYKGFENIGGFEDVFGRRITTPRLGCGSPVSGSITPSNCLCAWRLAWFTPCFRSRMFLRELLLFSPYPFRRSRS